METFVDALTAKAKIIAGNTAINQSSPCEAKEAQLSLVDASFDVLVKTCFLSINH